MRVLLCTLRPYKYFRYSPFVNSKRYTPDKCSDWHLEFIFQYLSVKDEMLTVK